MAKKTNKQIKVVGCSGLNCRCHRCVIRCADCDQQSCQDWQQRTCRIYDIDTWKKPEMARLKGEKLNVERNN
jgi:hypothetical protein